MSFSCVGKRVNLIVADRNQLIKWESGESYYALTVWHDTKGFFFEGEFYDKAFVHKWFKDTVPAANLMLPHEREDYLADRWLFTFDKIHELYEDWQIEEFDYMTPTGEFLHIFILLDNE